MNAMGKFQVYVGSTNTTPGNYIDDEDTTSVDSSNEKK